MSASRGKDRGFGGFTFLNNSSDKDGEEVAATHEPDTEAEAHPVLDAKNSPRLPKGGQGNAPYADVFGGRHRSKLTVWVASGEVVDKKQSWCCYELVLTQAACGVRLTNEVSYNDLARCHDECTVEIQLEEDGMYQVDADAEIHFLSDGIPDLKQP